MKMKFILVLALGMAVAQVKRPEGPVRNVNRGDYDTHKLSAKNYMEAWNYNFYLNDGSLATVTFSKSKLPMKGEVFGGELSLTGFKGRNPSVSRQYPVHRFAWKDEIKGLELTSGEKTRMAVEGMPGVGHRVVYQTDKDKGFYLDLTFKSAAAGKVIGDGLFTFNSQYFGQVICIPEGSVEGVIAVGSDTLKVQGAGVMEKYWQSRLLDELAAHVIQVYKPGEYVGRAILTEQNYSEAIVGYTMVKENGAWVPKFYDSFLNDGAPLSAKSGLPTKISLIGEGFEQSFERKKDRIVYSPLDNIDGWFEKKAIQAAIGEVKVHRGKADGVFYNLLEK